MPRIHPLNSTVKCAFCILTVDITLECAILVSDADDRTRESHWHRKAGAMIKRCSKCRKVKPLAEFHRDAGRKDGHSKRCKVCMTELSRSYDAKNRGQRKEAAKQYRENNKEEHKKKVHDYRARNKDTVRAAAKLHLAIADGTMPSASKLNCDICGRQAQDYHHPDYSKPLDVIPLCRSCHRRLHAASKV